MCPERTKEKKGRDTTERGGKGRGRGPDEGAGEDPLAKLVVIDELEVGPVRVEPRRIVAPYRVHQGGAVDELELIYRFEEAILDRKDPATRNMAAVVAAQVALNYGLFCRRIVFHGPFDQHDRRFLEDMARNTAREIYVVKLLQPNPFILGEAAQLPALRRRSYVAAELVFPDLSRRSISWKVPAEARGEAPKVDRSRYAILSSGGKDSLLSFGLLTDLGSEVHPIFINESGRHWFTALNAYRHLKETHPFTARVWTNADRMFTWMLRHLPFVRQDFADMRSDEYPIRLWTVAVFIFGAIPLVRRLGIGRIIIGDEYDTTERTTYKGITHYSGLFDQSRYFDNVLTRYYHRKGLGASQFSLLRQMSEMLIERTLYERYPDLQRHQVSCHATHLDGDRALPCGQCEKCRRIVGMLLAHDGDPKRSGYTDAHIKACLVELAKKGIHQEPEGAQYLAHLLHLKGLLPSTGMGKLRPRDNPEVMKLRFDRERSPMETIPQDLRQDLYGMLLGHAEGAVRRRGRLWIDFDLLTDPSITIPYPLEASVPQTTKDGGAASGVGDMVDLYLLGELTWPQAKERLKEVDVALLPVGSIEQHGPHLPLDTDAFDADFLAKAVAEACSEPKPLVLPLISYGVSYHHDDFAGTISISPDALSRLVYEVGMSLARNGITKLVIINGHGGNTPALRFAAQNINRDARIFTTVDTGDTSDHDISSIIDTPNDVHSGEIETSTTLANRPHLVRMDLAKKFVPKFSSQFLDFSTKRSLEWYTRTAKISPSGVLGDPTKASAEKGERIWSVMIRNMVEFIESIKRMSLDEIYQRRY
jgi:creatinine amidohydrolase/Fe(II)-dependent formamide hydrolase-like protein